MLVTTGWRRVVSWLLCILATAAMAPAAGLQRPEVALIDDFEDGDLIATAGLAWVPVGDDLLGGDTALRLEPRGRGSDGSRGALRMTGTLGSAATAFGGAWTPAGEGGRATDLSRFAGLRLALRGEGEVLVGIRRGSPMNAVNFMTMVPLGGRWVTHEIPFESLRPMGKGHENEPWDPRDAGWVGVSTVPGSAGRFTVDIDDVAYYGDSGAAPGAAPRDAVPTAYRTLVPDPPERIAALPWRLLSEDGAGDGRTGLPDARALHLCEDPARPLVWFRIDLNDRAPERWIGVNIALDVDDVRANGTPWWGKNTAFRFDRLVTVWVFRSGDRYDGTIGVVSSDAAAAGNLTNGEDVHLAVDRAAGRVYVGVPSAAVPSGARLVAAVGSPLSFSDDLPDDAGAAVPPRPGPRRGIEVL